MSQRANEYEKLRRTVAETRKLKRFALALLLLNCIGIVLLLVLESNPWTWLG